MGNDSSTGGYLTPAVATPPVEDADLDAVFQTLIVGVTGLSGALVFPRWQTTVPKQPSASTNWAAVGVLEQPGDTFPTIVHNPAGFDTLIRSELINAMASFYGPQGRANAEILRDGLFVTQNLEALYVQGFGLVDVSEVRAMPEFFNQQWVRRYDLTIQLRRQFTRQYAVDNIGSAGGTIGTDPGGTTINVT